MNDDHDLDWLAARRPVALARDDEATDRARVALVAHATVDRRPRMASAPPATAAPRRAERRWIRPSRVLALAGVAAAGVLAISAVWGGDRRPGSITARLPVVQVDDADAALTRLARHIKASPKLTGDATLIVRTHHFPDQGTTMKGFDLYADVGRYYYGATLAELRRSVSEGNPVDPDGTTKREIAAAAAASAVDLNLDDARQRMIGSTYDHGVIPPADDAAPPAAAADPTPEAQQQLERKEQAGEKAAGDPATAREIDDNRVWIGCMDALMAGFGRNDVRAGVLALLTTIEGVQVSDGPVVDGKPTLVLDNGEFPDGYHEMLTIDADTSAPVKFVGGVPGQTPGVIMNYVVTRPTMASLAQK